MSEGIDESISALVLYDGVPLEELDLVERKSVCEELGDLYPRLIGPGCPMEAEQLADRGEDLARRYLTAQGASEEQMEAILRVIWPAQAA